MIYNDAKSAFADLKNLTFMISDSRALTDPVHTVFAAVRTATGDGHRYISDMYLRGVRAFIVEHIPDELAEGASGPDIIWLVVPDVTKAMLSLGAMMRDSRCHGINIAITGSRGKTVVKELIYQALLKLEDPVRSPRSWNSHIGVALSLWEFNSQHDHNIVEVGIDGPSQIQLSMEAINPQMGILTSITDMHDSGFESRQEKIRQKLKLFAGCRTLLYDACCHPQINELVKNACPQAVLIPVSCSPYTPERINKALAKAALQALGYERQADELLRDVAEVNSRIDVHEGLNDCLMLFDAFTSDLRSLRDALDYMRRRTTSGRTLTVILGDLQHWYGQDLDSLYRQANDLLHDYGVTRMIAVGPEIYRRREMFDPLIAKEFLYDPSEFLSKYDIDRFNSELILIKGAPDSGFSCIKDVLESPRHDTIMEINLDAAAHNFNYYRSLLAPGTGLIAMVKASAYGVGSLELAKTLQSCRAAYLAVAVADEGVELRRAGITMPILVLNPITNNYSALFDRRLEPTVFSLKEYFTLKNEARRRGITNYPIHIKLDTGMHRLGFIQSELPELCRYLSDPSVLRVESVFSHLATADCIDMDDYTEMQLNNYASMTDLMLSLMPYPFKRHILNTAGISRYPQYHYDMVRLGIGLYGVDPLGENPALETVARLSTTVIAKRSWPAGTTIGYGRRGLLKRDSVVATIPIGYADGIDRHFGCGAASFAVRGTMCPTIGSICMDLCMIDVTDVPGVQVGDEVEIFGLAAPIHRLSDVQGTIPYEILTSVSPRVRRIYFRE